MTTPSTRPPRVTMLITASGSGGAELQVALLAKALRERGWDVGVISMLALADEFRHLDRIGVRLASLEMRAGVPDPRALLRLRRILREWRPDILHGHMVHANILARLSRLVTRTPVVISTMHNSNEGSQARYVAYRLTDRLTEITTGVSALAVEEAIRRHAVSRDRIILVPNGIDHRRFEASTGDRDALRDDLGLDSRFVWLTAGRMTDAKGLPDLVAAFSTVMRQRSDAHLLLAGDGPVAGEIRAAVSAARLDDAVTFLGWRPDVQRLMAASDGFVLPSLWEGLPMVVLEASASALPVVATEVGGSREAVIDGTSGHIVPIGDRTALAGAMTAVMSLDEQARLAMGEAGRAHVADTFDLERIADRWEGIYRSYTAT